jgi:uncharacterized protein (DUF885 family)
MPYNTSYNAREFIEQYDADAKSLKRLYRVRFSPTRRARLSALAYEWLDAMESIDFESLSASEKVDTMLLNRHLKREIRALAIEETREAQLSGLLPFSEAITQLEESRALMAPMNAAVAASIVDTISTMVRDTIESKSKELHLAGRAAERTDRLRETLKGWFEYYNGYDPAFTWWLAQPYKAADAALERYAKFLREELVDPKTIAGHPEGRESLLEDLAYEMIPYSPEELIEIGEREFAWCEGELIRASKELGFGEDWRTAQAYVKVMHPEPGKQTEVVRALALEAIDYVESRDLLTVPPLAKETWRMGMMPAEAQKTNPFFLGGEQIIVSFPTDTMTHEEKLMSMRGNNTPFSRATVQHELIPGHHMQGFMCARHKPYRRLFSTPFWIEGWTLYWELLLWNLGFPRTPEERIGMLFWRAHRAARIVFSLKFHLGLMSTEECVEMLVERVGHERATAEGEVRRSFNGNYPPLYQAAYMLGGLQMMAIRRDLVDSGRMTDKQFHDAVMHENEMPLSVLRAILLKEPIDLEFDPKWRFDD